MKSTLILLLAAGLLTGCEKPPHIRVTDRRGGVWYISTRDIRSIEPVSLASGLTNGCIVYLVQEHFPILLDYDSDEAARRLGLR